MCYYEIIELISSINKIIVAFDEKKNSNSFQIQSFLCLCIDSQQKRIIYLIEQMLDEYCWTNFTSGGKCALFSFHPL
jgi:hypothetical protein